jgi:hypothetical protein
MIFATPLTAVVFFMPTPAGFFAVAFLAEIGLFLSTSPVNAIGLRAVPVELRASAMAAMIFAIHLFGDLWSPPALGALQQGVASSMRVERHDVTATTIAMMALPIVFALSAYLWWPRKREAQCASTRPRPTSARASPSCSSPARSSASTRWPACSAKAAWARCGPRTIRISIATSR